ncbi:MAG: murein biosynthesis integral membrane protein MurJ [Gemmatimonadetes bacterium]|nr:murein biosynthesis integral membrane protein MurJ [Gemmatimonadota bacterium]
MAGRQAAKVAAGILVTRVLGFARERVFAHYFGNSGIADAFRAALKIPNVIRNLLGEGTLSASFIPVYAGMIERGDTAGARRLAGVIASLLLLLTGGATIMGVVLAPLITDFAAPGFSGPTRDLTVTLVAIMFPMSELTILSAWCLGILNTHRRFFLAYAAPALWNVAQISTLVGLGGYLAGADLAVALAWGAVAGSLLQLVVQLPATLRNLGAFSFSLGLDVPGVQTVARNWAPVVVGAGVTQISSIIDTQLGSFLGLGAVATLGYAQLVAVLPVSLFGVSVAAAALPELSRDAAGQGLAALRDRVAQGARRVVFFVVPSACALGVLGTPIVGALFQTGQFTGRDTTTVAAVLACYAIGIPAQASVKLLASAFYALGDTRSPVRAAALSMVLSAGLAYLLMLKYGAPGIALGASLAAYANVLMHVQGLRARIPSFIKTGTGRVFVVTAAASLAATGAGWAVMHQMAAFSPWIIAGPSLGAFALVYLAGTAVLGHPDAQALIRKLANR